MEKMIYTADELNNAGRDELIRIVLSLQENIAQMTQNQELILEQLAILRGQRFGRHSEKMNVVDGQMSLFFIDFFLDTVSLPHKPFCTVRQCGR